MHHFVNCKPPAVASCIIITILFDSYLYSGFRTNASTVDLSGVLPEELEAELKSAAEISMGSEISDEDILQIKELCEEVVNDKFFIK